MIIIFDLDKLFFIELCNEHDHKSTKLIKIILLWRFCTSFQAQIIKIKF